MTNKETGGPVFPNGFDVTQGQFEPHGGMTLRDYIATKVMQAYYTNSKSGFSMDLIEETARLVSRISYRIADSMLKARDE